jgi:sugar phosphate isomerase/epimerase
MATKISRRRFLAGSAAAAVAATAGGPFVMRALAAPGGGLGERLAPPGKLGVQQFSIRDAITRRSIANSVANSLTPTRGYLGGPNFPMDPTDLGPLVDLPGGFNEVFAYLASLGYAGFEFFQFSQNVNELGRQPTIPEIRGYLDAAGLKAQGTHTAGLGGMYDVATGGISAGGQTTIDNALILGMTMVGTAGDPSGRETLSDGPPPQNQIGWTEAARRANVVGAACAAAGLRWYWHVEQNGYRFFNDPDHPELARTHRWQWFADNTDPGLIFFEPDTLHGYAGRARFPDPVDGTLVDLFGWWKDNWQRIVAWHIKDGIRLAPPPLPGVNPFTQTVARPGFITPTDALYTGEGSIGKGYPIDPDPGVVGFKRIFEDVGAKGSRFYIVESDSAIGPAADPGRSLRHAKLGAAYMLGLRAGPNTNAAGVVSDEPEHSHEEGEAEHVHE